MSSFVKHCGLTFLLMVLLDCSVKREIKSTKPISDHSATQFAYSIFRGIVLDDKGMPCFANIEALSDTGCIYGITTSFESGTYQFSVPYAKANDISHFQVSQVGYNTLRQNFDHSLLDDSINLDFVLIPLPIDTIIIRAYPSHRLFPKDSVSRD